MVELTDEQWKMYPAIRWLISDGPRAQGKSTLMAMAFLERGFKQLGQWVDVYDHFRHVKADTHTLKMVHSLFNQMEKKDLYGISIMLQHNKFRVFHVDIKGNELKKLSRREYEL